MTKKNRATQPRILLCSNDLTQSIKEHNLVEHKLFYNMYYYFRLREKLSKNENGTIDGYNQEEKEVYLDYYTLKKLLGKRYSKNEIQGIIHRLPNQIRIKGKSNGFVSIYEYVIMNEEGDLEYKYTDTFMEFASCEIPVKKPHTALDLNEMIGLRRTYSQRLYELYKQYSSNAGEIGQGNFKMTRGYLYEFFNVPSTMKISEVIRQGIIPAIEELNSSLGIKIPEPKIIKKGRTITHIHFHF